MPDWLGPSDEWPTHPDADARKALAEARRSGWWFKPTGRSGHVFGTLTCTAPAGARLGVGNCAHRVYSTAGNSGETAKVVRQWLNQCPHEPLTDGDRPGPQRAGQGRIDTAHARMNSAAGLLDAAHRLREDTARRHRAGELVEEADSAAEEAEEILFSEAVVEESRADDARAEARRLAEPSGLGHDPWPPEDVEERLVNPARDYVAAADELVGDQVDDLATAARRRLGALRQRLTEWDSDQGST